MEQSPSWEANSHSAIQEIPHLLMEPCSQESASFEALCNIPSKLFFYDK
jgi:hypothetical protein